MRSKSVLIKLGNIYFKNSIHNIGYVEAIYSIFFPQSELVV